MKILVVDIPADKGGALTILDMYYKKACEDFENEYVFLLSIPTYPDTKNVKILNYPWTKKSWLHQIYFNYFRVPKLMKQIYPDRILSLQNHQLPFTNIPQTVYLQNVLPFADYKFSLFKSPLLWFYQNIYGRFLKHNLRDVDHLIVQAEWMKEKMTSELKLNPDIIEVDIPKIEIEVKEYFDYKNMDIPTFFYPASALEYKNHQMILDACVLLKEEGIYNYRVIFTIAKDENRYARRLWKFTKEKHLPVQFVGYLTKEEIYDYYSKSILVFPSLIETVGIPLYESISLLVPLIVISANYSIRLSIFSQSDVKKFEDKRELSVLLKKEINTFIKKLSLI